MTDNPTWMIDPIDGTSNFIHGYFMHMYECHFVAAVFNLADWVSRQDVIQSPPACTHTYTPHPLALCLVFQVAFLSCVHWTCSRQEGSLL